MFYPISFVSSHCLQSAQTAMSIHTWGATYDDFSGRYFRIFEIIIFYFVVAIRDLVHDVKLYFTSLMC